MASVAPSQSFETEAVLLPNMAMAPATMSSTIFFAGSMAWMPPTPWPARLFTASKPPLRTSGSSAWCFRSCSRGTTPWLHISWILAGVASQDRTQSFGMRRRGRPETVSVRMVSSLFALRTLSLCDLGAEDSSAQMKRVPTQTPAAPRESAAARPRPSKIPPAATQTTGTPKAEGLPRQRSTTWGMRGIVPISPVCPPPSEPWAMMTSTPASRAFSVFRAEPTMLATTTPPAWSFSTAHLGGTPTAQMKSFAPSATMMSMSSGRWPWV
mmetsp:Transcript_96059/g.271919  ORF Transcript_96059/g.271919 Transcript_96059/m.271919 type:complete len:268 (+) Transcript_96059:175-978(+)